MIKYLVDTNILGYFARNSSAALQKRMLAALKKQEVAISAITRAETRFGQALLQADDKRRQTMDLLLNELPVLPWMLEAADRYGEIAAHLKQTGQSIGDMDTQIAAHALALDLPLVTHNTRAHSTCKTLDCPHGWRAPATFDACHHALSRVHECGHIALRQVRLRECCNQFRLEISLGAIAQRMAGLKK